VIVDVHRTTAIFLNEMLPVDAERGVLARDRGWPLLGSTAICRVVPVLEMVQMLPAFSTARVARSSQGVTTPVSGRCTALGSRPVGVFVRRAASSTVVEEHCGREVTIAGAWDAIG